MSEDRYKLFLSFKGKIKHNSKKTKKKVTNSNLSEKIKYSFLVCIYVKNNCKQIALKLKNATFKILNLFIFWFKYVREYN